MAQRSDKVTNVSASTWEEDSLLSGFAIDRSSPVPLYFQVAQHLEHAIESGDIPNGTLFDKDPGPNAPMLTLTGKVTDARTGAGIPELRAAMARLAAEREEFR